jgi:uncharacterized protein (TIGR04255 family)
MSNHKYRNPPIDEATCQFTLAERIPWDPVIPGRLFDHFKSRYPGMPSQQQLLQANLTPGAGIPTPSLALVQNDRIVFVDDAGTDRLSVGPETIGVHRTRPYVGFEEELLPRITADLPEVLNVLELDGSFKAVSVRYVNRIIVDDAKFELGDYFLYWGTESVLPEPFDGKISGFFYRTTATQTSRSDTLALTFASIDAPKDSSAFLLDIDLTHNFEDPVTGEQAREQLVDLKLLENAIFESLITDKCRSLFE